MENTTQNLSNGKSSSTWDKKKIGALWERTSQSGNNYLSGEIEFQDNMGVVYVIPIQMFPSKMNRDEGKQYPSFNIYEKEQPMRKVDWVKKYCKGKTTGLVPQVKLPAQTDNKNSDDSVL